MQICTLLQTDNRASIPPLSFSTGQMSFLPPNQQHQSTTVTVTGDTIAEENHGSDKEHVSETQHILSDKQQIPIRQNASKVSNSDLSEVGKFRKPFQ